MNYIEGFKKLQEFSKSLENIEYSDIIEILKESIKYIPIPIAKLKKGTCIKRARHNNGTFLFSSIDDLSYIKKTEVIEKLTEFGRANKPHEVLFYSAIQNPTPNEALVTAIAETSRLFSAIDSKESKGEVFTVGSWRNRSDLNVAEMVFAESAIENNEGIKRSFEQQKKNVREMENIDTSFFEDFLVFISNEFARVANTNADYKISTAYAELVLRNKNIQGIVYPSVQVQYIGTNLLLPPTVVDNFLYIEFLETVKLFYKKELTLDTRFGYFSKEFTPCIKWEKK